MATLLNTIEDPKARDICRSHGDRPDELIEILHDVQDAKGFLSDSSLRTIADALNISRAEIHGVRIIFIMISSVKKAPSKRLKSAAPKPVRRSAPMI